MSLWAVAKAQHIGNLWVAHPTELPTAATNSTATTDNHNTARFHLLMETCIRKGHTPNDLGICAEEQEEDEEAAPRWHTISGHTHQLAPALLSCDQHPPYAPTTAT